MSPTMKGLIAIACWSTSGLMMALAARLPPFEILTLNWGLSALVLYAVGAAGRVRGEDQGPRPLLRLSDGAFLFFGYGGALVCYYYAFQMIPAFEANSLNYIWPLVLMFLVDFGGRRRRVNILHIIGMLLGFGGCILLFAGKAQGTGFDGLSFGHALALAGGVIWAVYSFMAEGRDYPPSIMPPVFLASALFYAVMHVSLERWIWPAPLEWVAVAFLMLTSVVYVLWDQGIRHGDKVLLTSVSYMIPLASTALMIAGGFSASSPLVFAGGALIVLGCLVVNADKVAMLMKRRSA